MHTREASELALAEMKKWGLLEKGWRFTFDQSKRRFGVCRHGQKVIGLSSPLTLCNQPDEVRDTILHEIAHALAGYANGHNGVWKQHCLLVGARPIRCYSTEHVVQPDMNYEAICPKCARVVKKDRLPHRTRACGVCCKRYNGGRFNLDFVLNFYRTGTHPRPMIQPAAAPSLPKPPVTPAPVGQLSMWKEGKYVPVAQVTKVEFGVPPESVQHFAKNLGLDCFDAKMCVHFYRQGMRVADIAVKMGYKRGHGQNRVRKALVDAGAY